MRLLSAEVLGEELLHCAPMLFGSRLVIGSVIGDGEAVFGRVPLQNVFHARVSQRLFQSLLILDGVGRVVLGAADVHRGPDLPGQQMRAARIAGGQPTTVE